MTSITSSPHGASSQRNALVLIATVAAGAALYWLRGILTPLALALFLMVIIDGFSRVLKTHLRILSDRAAFIVAIVLTVAGFGVTAFLIAGNAPAFLSQLMADIPRLNAVIGDLSARVHIQNPPTVQQLAHQLDLGRFVGATAGAVQGVASTTLFVLIYLGFLFASRGGLQHKTERLFPNLEERQGASVAFAHIRNGIERYLWIQTVTGLIIAVTSGLVLWASGMQNPLFWGFLILVTSYIPIVGGMIAQFLPPLLALVEFDTYWKAAIILAGLTVIQGVVGSIIFPRMQGRSLNLDPVVILLSLAFWGLVWGVPGMFLSTPLTVMLMVVSEQFPGARWVAILLSHDGEPEAVDETPADPSAALPKDAQTKPAKKSHSREDVRVRAPLKIPRSRPI